MRLLFVQDSLGTGGAERSNADFWDFIRTYQDIQVKIVVLEHRKEGVEQEVLNKNFDVTFLEDGSFLNQIGQISDIIKIYKPDIVHSVLWRSVSRVRVAHTFGSFHHLESLVNCSYSKIRYEDPSVNKLGLSFFKYLNRISHPLGTDGFIAISQEVKKHGMKYLKIPANKIEVISRGRRANSYLQRKEESREQLKKELKVEDPALLIVHVGRQEYPKGHLVLLKAIEESKDKLLDSNIHFLFCGRTGNSTADLQKFQEEHRIPNLHWLGHRPDIEQILAGSDVFVFPSISEGLGGALIEAQAAGLPIVCSDIPVFKEVVQENINALTFKMGDYKDLSEKIHQISDPILRGRMGIESLKIFKEKFEITEIHKELLSYYKKFLN